MSRLETVKKIKQNKIVPVIRAASALEAEKTIEILFVAGVRIIEITMTTPGALGLIEKYSAATNSEVLIGAGTVFDIETAEKCAAAGARFIVSPVIAAEMIACCRRDSIAAICGAFTPTEIYAASLTGADFVKVFPANAAGGASYIKSVKAVFPSISIMPTGGITLATAAQYFEAGAEAVGIGGGLNDFNTEAVENFLGAIK